MPATPLRVLVACEYSGRVRDAFRALGHHAVSCDLEPTEVPGPHHQGDVRELLDAGWDLLVGHPPCTYLASMGVWWNHKRPERWQLTYDAAEFVKLLWNAPIQRVALENPVGWLNSHWQPPTQIVHPWQFGHEANKPTCLWLRGLDPLKPTQVVGKGEFYTKANGSRISKWSHVTSGTDKAKRAKIASRTFEGIAQAMAMQWGGDARPSSDNA